MKKHENNAEAGAVGSPHGCQVGPLVERLRLQADNKDKQAMQQDAMRAADEIERLQAALISVAEVNNPLSALAIHFLVAAGFVSQEKADEAFRLAHDLCKRRERPNVAVERPERSAGTAG